MQSVIFLRKSAVLRFETPFGGLRGKVQRLSLAHWKARGVADFLLALIELFPLGVTAEALRAIIGSKSTNLLQRGPVNPKFHVPGVATQQRRSQDLISGRAQQ